MMELINISRIVLSTTSNRLAIYLIIEPSYLLIQVYCAYIRDCTFILSKACKPARLLETVPRRGKIRYSYY